MGALVVVIIVLAIGLVIAGIIWSNYLAKKGREELGRIAAGLGLTFSPGDPFNIPSRYSSFGALSAGDNRSAYNVIHGNRGPYQVKAFDYVYYTTETSTDAEGNTTSREQSHYLSAVIFDSGVGFPSLFIRPENFLDKIAAAIGFDDIDFESEEFSRKFYVKSSDKTFAYDVIHPRMMEFLLQHPRCSLQLQGQSVLTCKSGNYKPEEFSYTIGFLETFLKNIPDYVWEQLRGGVRS